MLCAVSKHLICAFMLDKRGQVMEVHADCILYTTWLYLHAIFKRV